MLLSFLFTGSNAYADLVLTDTYYSLQYASLAFDTGSSTGLLKFNMGKKINPTYSYEGQLGLATESNANEGLLTFGGYLRANKYYEEFTLYGLAGFGSALAYSDDNNSVSSFSAGAGIEVIADKSFSLTLEMIQLVYEDDEKMYTIGLGYTYYFYEDDSRFIGNNERIKSIRQYYR